MRRRVNDLEADVVKLEKHRRDDQWAIFNLTSRVEQAEMTMRLLQERVQSIPHVEVDLTVREETVTPGIGGPIDLGISAPTPTSWFGMPSLAFSEEELGAIESIASNWALVDQENRDPDLS